MNFGGFVPLRRGIIAHTQRGRLSNTECLVLIFLIMLADKGSGAGTINAPCLRTFLPGLTYDAAKRVLESLEEKRYIFRQIIPFSKIVYPFWVNRYIPTVGKYKSLQCSLTKAFETRDVKDIEYVQPPPDDAPDSTPESAPENALEAALHYKKNKDNNNEKENRENSLLEKNVSDTMSVQLNGARQAEAERTLEQASALPDATQGRAQVHSMLSDGLTSSVQKTPSPGVSRTWTWGDPLLGYEFRCGEQAGYWSPITGKRITPEELEKSGLLQR